MSVKGCSCPTCPKCPNPLGGRDWMLCRGCALGWHRAGHCDVPVTSPYFPVEWTCMVCGFALSREGKHS